MMHRLNRLDPWAMLLAVVILSGSVNAQQQPPALGGASADAVSSIEEQRLGRQFMRAARRQMEFSSDPEITGYVRGLGETLLASGGLSASDFTFSVVNDSALNAFAVPGGFISVHSGLIVETESESELASVMAHEIAHVTQRHLPRMIARSRERSLPAAAAMVAAILLGGQMGSAALIGTNAALISDQLRYSREFEKEADAMGMRLLSDSRFDPGAMPAFFQKLQRNSMLYASEVPEYLRTHPLSVSRIADSEGRLGDYPERLHDSGHDYLMVRARTRALTSVEPMRTADYFIDLATGDGPASFAARYGEGLARMAAGQYSQAREILTELAARRPGDLYVQLAVGQLALRAGQVEQAVTHLRDLYESYGTESPLAEYYAQALVAEGDYASARKVIRRWQRTDPENPQSYLLLSRVDGELGRHAESFQARAEYFALLFETRRALSELEQARRHAASDHYLLASIAAREKELVDELARYGEDEINK